MVCYYFLLRRLRSRDRNSTTEKTAIETIKLESANRGASIVGLVVISNAPPPDIKKPPCSNKYGFVINVINPSK